MTVTGAWSLVVGASAGLMVATWLINSLCFRLSPVALLVVCFYSFTQAIHGLLAFLSRAWRWGLRRSGAWLAVRGQFDWPPCVLAAAVVFWLVGFDIIYATQDYEFDKSQGLHSLPARLGIAGSLRMARVAHGVMAVLLLAFGLISHLRRAILFRAWRRFWFVLSRSTYWRENRTPSA